MNSRAEFNCSFIRRLAVEMKDKELAEERLKKNRVVEDENIRNLEAQDAMWEDR